MLPFFVLIRGAVFFYERYEMNQWVALLLSITAASGLLMVYLLTVYRWIFGPKALTKKQFTYKVLIVLSVVLGYCGYTLISWPEANTGRKEVAQEFSELHPFLRLAVGTVLFVDRDIIVNDFSRIHSDYQRMGLPGKEQSLHYIQPATGYAHAMDLRTRERFFARNWLLSSYFRLMGFHAVEHGGTGRHLHVSLSVHDRPGAW